MPAWLAAGFGEACQIASEQWEKDADRMSKLTLRLREGLQKTFPNVQFFGHLQKRLPGSLSIGFPGFPASEVLDTVSDRIAISTGSACASGAVAPSNVLLALHLDRDIASTGVRISLGRFTDEQEIEAALSAFSDIASIANRR